METRIGHSIPAVVTELPDVEVVSSYLTVLLLHPRICTSPICHPELRYSRSSFLEFLKCKLDFFTSRSSCYEVLVVMLYSDKAYYY